MARRLYAFRRTFRIERHPDTTPTWWNNRPGPGPSELRFSRDTLIEVTAKELRDDAAMYGPRLERLVPVDYRRAHQWVREGGHHGTGLWTDIDGRIRYAEGED